MTWIDFGGLVSTGGMIYVQDVTGYRQALQKEVARRGLSRHVHSLNVCSMGKSAYVCMAYAYVCMASVDHLLNTALSSKLRWSRELNPGLMLQLRVTVALTSPGKVIKAHAQVCPRLQTSHLWATPIHK